jgi:queuosine precursor transporter
MKAITQLSVVILWLAAIVLANYNIGWFGPEVSIINAFFLIGLSITTRDLLHEMWDGRGLRWKMLALIAVGGVISYLTQPALGRIAAASVAAFAVTAVVDALVYHRTRSINKSNAVSSAFDSVLFPVLAFGGFPIWIILGQYVAKVLGGAAWAWVLKRKAWAILLATVGVTTAQGQHLNIGTFATDTGNIYNTVEAFVPGDVTVFSFIDYNWSDPKVVYGETAVYWRNLTVQAEYGDAKFFSIDEVLLVGVAWKGLELMYRTDGDVQLTYVWFWRKGRFQFNGYIDAWGWDNWQAITQPQAWVWVTDWVAIGGEAFVRADRDSVSVTPAIGITINRKF